MPRLVRRTPLIERIKARLDPYDLLLWLAEELNDDAYEEWLKIWAAPIGFGLNVAFILARGASRSSGGRGGRDDVFGDMEQGSGWFAWLSAFLVQSLTLLCCLNAGMVFFARKSYRLFEQPVDIAPATPSAHRVRVDSSPMSSSPLRYLQGVISSATASSRAYPDAEREVWELAIWDPKPFNLSIFTLFSPGHVLVYYLLLPPNTMDSRPTTTVMTAVAFSALLSLQLWFLKASFSQQAKDSALVHGEVMNEYDTKFVRPILNRPVRDVGIQTRESALTPRGTKTREVDVYTSTTIVNRGFKTNPNPNYASQYDPDNLASRKTDSKRSSNIGTPQPFTDTPTNGYTNAYTQSRPTTSGAPDFSSPIKPHHELLRERIPMKGDGGSLGVYTHAASPLRKAASSNQLRAGREREGLERRTLGTPLKRMSTLGNGSPLTQEEARRRRETGRF
ncbi:uncharacterized protein MYCGRDRAFT_71656 [Zymoseptoria tritici IPO323]|uniref:Meiotically up-regulated gene 154 protein n=1 Tax=Zymoseptoria tritici (strain CBS 115943 / IPO323) TaxID=336722 RepID=F9X9T6_ZYMTI|nr:uncharacterized protein MYCGRDRAFT_71656 [Zymoseptoria tritici IPO323]EGP88159.1 hypothetical protein MYCGRDRAFT_71656 [Zymoseptoria tritici IPO323]